MTVECKASSASLPHHSRDLVECVKRFISLDQALAKAHELNLQPHSTHAKLTPVIRQNCVRGHVITLQRGHNGDEDRRAAGLR